jgi:hypothetical protein
VLVKEKSSDGRSNGNFFNVQSTELIVDTIVDKITCTFCIGFFIPNGDTAIVGLNTNSVVFHALLIPLNMARIHELAGLGV